MAVIQKADIEKLVKLNVAIFNFIEKLKPASLWQAVAGLN